MTDNSKFQDDSKPSFGEYLKFQSEGTGVPIYISKEATMTDEEYANIMLTIFADTPFEGRIKL